MIDLVAWFTEKEAEAQKLYEEAERLDQYSDMDYYQGLMEAYGVAKSKIEEAVNG